MLNVYICEDNPKQQELFEKVINNIIMIENFDLKLELSTSSPDKLLSHIADIKHTGLYFLDIDLNAEMNGIILGSKIREFDPRGFIVFVTTHAEMSYLTFIYKVEAMDYIIKDNYGKVKERIHDCIKKAYFRYTSINTDVQKLLNLKINDRMVNIEFNQILFIETSTTAHKLIIHAFDRQIEFYSKMKDILPQLDERFYRCHNSFIVNKEFIKEIDLNKRCIYMTNGEECLISTRMMKGLIR